MRERKGESDPVLTLRGFRASDLSMAPMRRYLKELGYDTYAWKMGRNVGGVSRMRAALRDRLAGIHNSPGPKPRIVRSNPAPPYAPPPAPPAPPTARPLTPRQ